MKQKVDLSKKEEILDFFKKRMLTTKEAAFYLGLSIITVRRKAGNGEIPSYRPNGKNLYFEISELDEYILSKHRSSVEKSQKVAANLNFKISKKWKI
ncbi:helix-turn-helix domain-containing protein [Epilithonimonas caeni]|uniref:helix-turn-helix domain-containing protein n=1 Tax=Epilithonimonas caeni TaxID=365343 RepID=UPI000427C0BC|nr:helix-turn-helix domain-containing protein [Epilithonimonas caeni]